MHAKIMHYVCKKRIEKTHTININVPGRIQVINIHISRTFLVVSDFLSVYWTVVPDESV